MMRARSFGQPRRRRICRSAAALWILASGGLGALAHAQDIIPPKAYSVTPGGVNVADRSLVYSVTDLSLGPLKLERFHRTGQQQPNDAPFGSNFSYSFDIYVAVNVNVTGTADTVIVHLGNSASGTYSQQHSNAATITDHNLDAGKAILRMSAASSFTPIATARCTPSARRSRPPARSGNRARAALSGSIFPTAGSRPYPTMAAAI